MNILAISSQVVFGHVGNSAARFVLERLGHDVWAIPTTLLSHHPGHGKPAGRATPVDEIAAIVDSLAERCWLENLDAVMTGYFASAQQVEAAARAIGTIRAAKPDLPVLCDPIMGDDGAIYVADGVPEALRDALVPLATMLTPNTFELAWLNGEDWRDVSEANIGDMTGRLKADEVVVTSVGTGDPGRIAVVGTSPGAKPHRVEHTRYENPPRGTGDVLAAGYLARRLDGKPPREALYGTTGAVAALIRRAVEDGAIELPLVAAQDLLLD